jgi:pimeloyl-ACP methyl ester carboxylesterase
MLTTPRRPTRRRPLVRFPVLLGLVLVFTPGAAACSAASTTRTGTDQSGSLGRGRLVDVGGRHLYLACQGTGTPVVFVAGLGDRGETAWGAVWGQVARSTRACVYDRAGLGRSDPNPTAAIYQAATDDLRALLQRGRILGPYLLVGHSLGGLLARLYAHQHPAHVAAVVLVDATPVDWFPAVQRLLPAALLSPLAHNPEGFDLRHGLTSLTPLDRPGVLDRCPLVVIWAPNQPPPGLPASTARELAGRWEAEQAGLARLSSASRLQRVPGSGHYLQRDRPELVVAGIDASCAYCVAPRRRQPGEAMNSPAVAARAYRAHPRRHVGVLQKLAARLEPCAPTGCRRSR